MTDEVPAPGPGDPESAGEHPAEARDEAPDSAPDRAEGTAPLGVVRTPTGHAGVDALLERLADADHLTADGHVEVYEDVHRGLREALSALDAPSVPAPYENRS